MFKKGASELWWVIAAAIIALLVVIFMVMWFKGSGSTAFGEINKKIGGLSDRDKDNVADMFDQCPDVPGKPELDGCAPKPDSEEEK